MRLFFILSLLLTTTTIYTMPLTSEQEESLDNLAWLYAQFSLTFDGNELPLDDFYRANKNYFDLYEDVLDFFNDSNLQRYFTGLDISKVNNDLNQLITQYKSQIVKADSTPIPFKLFYGFFQLIRNLGIFHGSLVASLRDTWNLQYIDKESKLENFANQFCIVDVNILEDHVLIQALTNFKIEDEFKLDKDKEKRFFMLSEEYVNKLKGNKEPKPTSWSAHHIIPSNILVKFHENYFKLLNFKSQTIIKTHKFDWVKINEINTQKAFLVSAQKLWKFKPGATLPVNDYHKNEKGQQFDFIKTWYRWPLGLMFYGPQSEIRFNDPEDKFDSKAIHIVGKRYLKLCEQLNTELVEFNKKFKVTPTTIFNDYVLSKKIVDYLNGEAMRLYEKLHTIYKEYNNGKPVHIFPYNADQWIYTPNPTTKKQKTRKWTINDNFDANSVIYDTNSNQWIDMNDNSDDGPSIEVWKAKIEWREKALTQEADNFRQMLTHFNLNLDLNLPTPNLMVPDLSTLSFFGHGSVNPLPIQPVQPNIHEPSTSGQKHDELRRRKRVSSHHPLLYYFDKFVHKCKVIPTTTTKPFSTATRDPCDYFFYNGSPSLLALPAYGLCKLFG